VKGPLLSRSGYGEQSRFALRALRSRPELFDIYIINIPWGNTGHIAGDSEEKKFINHCAMKAAQHVQQGGTFDISVQVTIPNEFEKIAPVNIGYTAGIETTKIAPVWIQKINEMVDKVIVVSSHSKKVLEQTTYDMKDQHGNDLPGWGVQVPVESINYPVRSNEAEDIELNLVTDNNFLVISQWGPRKNLENTIKWFVEKFQDDDTVGLVLKTNIARDSVTDREFTTKRLEAFLNTVPDRKCKVYLVHGDLTPGQLTTLYTHPTMKALINIGHGEGFGLPLFEAAYNGLPLITTTWSGQLDFITKLNKKGKNVPRIAAVDYDIKQVQKEAVWPGVIQEDSMWAFAREASFKRVLGEVLEKETHYTKEAEILKNHILENFTEEKMYGEFVQLVYGKEAKRVDVADLPKISLITSVYKASEHIEQLMEDTTNQTIFDEKCEWILINVNEPGDDFEEEIILKYAQKYPNIRYKRLKTDPGVYGVWNKAIKMATGEFISNINCDDRRAPDALRKQAETLVAHEEISLVYNDSYIVKEPNTTWDMAATADTTRYNFDAFSVESMLRSNLPHNNPMWKRSLHDNHGLFDPKYKSAGDWDFWLKCSFEGAVFLKHPEILGIYYFNPKGISTNPENDSWKKEEEFEVFKKYQKLYLEAK
jgi:glycosyltransferase involved in cell wall biosynthesis